MGDGYKVVPKALRAAQRPFDDAAVSWSSLKTDLDGWRLMDGDLGLIGRESGIVDRYNDALNTVQRHVADGAANFQKASTRLDAIARSYEAQDEQFYEQFGYLDSTTD